MSRSDRLRVNFTVSDRAKAAIGQVRRDYEQAFPDDPPAVLMIGWGTVTPNRGASFDGVVIAYYPQSQWADVAEGIQEVSGLRFIYFTTPEFHRNFEGKVLDHDRRRGFFLRAT